MMMRLFNRLKKNGPETLPHNIQPIFMGNKYGLFDDIVGFEDVKYLFNMAIQAQRPVHLVTVWAPCVRKIIVYAIAH